MDDKLIMSIGALVGVVANFLFGNISQAFYWLLVFCLVDYVTGMVQAFINKNWCSKVGFKGLSKKAVIISIAVCFHGLARSIELPIIETAVLFAFMLNEMCSILENIERAGFGAIIPASVRKILAVAEDKNNDYISKLK